MTSLPQLKYKCAATFGRFNIPHSGHVELVQQMLHCADYADVHLSGSDKNTDYDIRLLLFKYLCREANVDLSRVRFYNSRTVTEAMSFSVDIAPFKEVVLVLGSDQIDMGMSISKAYDAAFVINQRSTSSTEKRHFMDNCEFHEDMLPHFGGDEFALTLSLILHKDELNRAAGL